MASSGGSAWSWDPHRQDYYYVTKDYYGNYTYHYQNDQTQPAAQYLSTDQTAAGASSYSATNALGHNPTNSSYYTSQPENTIPYVADPRPRVDSSTGPTMPELAPAEVRATRNFIGGTPDQGWYERLDPSYRMRTGAEIHSFFKIGKVFAMLHIQAASANDPSLYGDNISVVQYGEKAYSQIRRFVVVDVRRGFVYACPIFTYRKQGTLKHGCIPAEHSVVYFEGFQCVTFPGEYERGLCRQPIRIKPASSELRMDEASRLHYGKVYPIEMNVKVKDIGDVDPTQISLLLQYYKEVNDPPSQQYSPPVQEHYRYQNQSF